MLGVGGVGDRRLLGDPGTGKGRKKEKEHTRKKRDGIRTAGLNRRDQVTATMPGPVSFERGNRGRLSGSSTYWVENHCACA